MSVNDKNVCISGVFIEKYLPIANPYFVKVYLYALGFSESLADVSIAAKKFATALNMLETDIDNAIKYWQRLNVIEVIKETQNPLEYTIRFSLEQNNEGNRPAPLHIKNNYSPEKATPSGKISKNKELKTMFLLAQNILGRTLNPADTKTLFSLYDWLNIPIDVILILLEYCVSSGNAKMSFIEKIAIEWHSMGLINVEAAEEYIAELAKKEHYYTSIKKALNINEKELSQNEKKYFSNWSNEFHSPLELILLANEYCVSQIGKTSVPYINAILKSWCEKGVTTAEQAKRGNDAYKNKSSDMRTQTKTSYTDYKVYGNGEYDYDEIARLAANKLNNVSLKKDR